MGECQSFPIFSDGSKSLTHLELVVRACARFGQCKVETVKIPPGFTMQPVHG